MGEPPAHLTDWKGGDWQPGGDELSSHPNSRFCTPIKQCPILADEYEDPQRRTDLGDPLRRPPKDDRAAGDRGP